MSLRISTPGGEQVAADERDDEKRRLSVFHLFGLAAGGVIGSGWLFGAHKTSEIAGSYAWLSWLLGGVVVLVIAGVMVELGTAVPKTGGLIFLPLQTSGALVATVVAAGLWIFYAINLASEAVAMTRGLSWRVDDSSTDMSLTATDYGYVLAFMMVISAMSLVAPWLFFHINSWLTVVKVVIPFLAVVLLIPVAQTEVIKGAPGQPLGVLYAVVSGGVIYSYMGFQGPLDFAGNIRRRGIGEAARMRRAVLGTISGSMILYLALQYVYDRYYIYQKDAKGSGLTSPFPHIAHAVGKTWLEYLLHIAALLSPMGTGLVFAYALTREVATLGGVHLTHRGLQTARKATFLNGRYDGYWLVLVVDFFVALIMLLVFGGSGDEFTQITGVLALIVYAFPGVVLAALRDRLTCYSQRRRNFQWCLTRVSFVLIALLLYGAGWPTLWKGMATLSVGSTVLLLLPLLSRWRPGLGRFYDAKEYVTLFGRLRTSPAAAAAICLIGYLALLTLSTLLGNRAPFSSDHHSVGRLFWGMGFLVVIMALVAFEVLVRMSRWHMVKEPPRPPIPPSPSPDASGAKG